MIANREEDGGRTEHSSSPFFGAWPSLHLAATAQKQKAFRRAACPMIIVSILSTLIASFSLIIAAAIHLYITNTLN